MINKKSQVKFGEMFAIIFIVWLVLVIGAVWYTNYNKKEIVKINEEANKNLAFERYSFIRNVPYLRVSQLGEVDYTFSLLAIQIFDDFVKDNIAMKQELKNSYSKITLIKNENNNGFSEEEILIYNLTPDSEEDFTKNVFRTIISIKNESDEKTYPGILEIVIFS